MLHQMCAQPQLPVRQSTRTASVDLAPPNSSHSPRLPHQSRLNMVPAAPSDQPHQPMAVFNPGYESSPSVQPRMVQMRLQQQREREEQLQQSVTTPRPNTLNLGDPPTPAESGIATAGKFPLFSTHLR